MQPYGALDCFEGRSEGDWGERREARAQWAQPPKAVSDPEFRQTTSGAHGSAGRADCLPRGKPFGAPAGATPCPWRGMTRRLWRGKRACSPMGRSIVSVGDPKGTGGERKAPSAPAGANPCPRRGLTRRLRRGLGLAVPWGAHTFLSVAKEKCAKESQRHGDSRGGPPRCA